MSPSRFLILAVMAGAVLSAAFSQAAETGTGTQPAQWILVVAPGLRTAMEPLVQRRRAQNFKVVVLETTNTLTPAQIQQGDGTALQTRLKEASAQFRGRSLILLAGNVFSTNAETALQTVVPSMSGVAGRMRGKPTDYPYSLPDSNGKPTVAVGRFPAANEQQARDMVRKTLRLEDDTLPGAWRNRLFLFMGDPNGGAIADMMVDPAIGASLAQLDPAWTVSGESATASRFQMPSDLLHDTALHSFGQGEMFSVVLVHSSAPAIWLTGKHWISRRDLASAQIRRGAGVFFTSGCFACQWRGAGGEGYGQACIRNPAGPAAVMGASAESYSAAGMLALEGLAQPLARAPFPTLLAQYWLAVQAALAESPMDALTFGLLDSIDGSNGKIPLPVQRREHLEMWLLLGDPALRLPMVPGDVTLQTAPSVQAGHKMTIVGALPTRLAGAAVRVTLERPLSEKPAGLDGPTAPSVETCARANNFILATAEAATTGVRFTCDLAPPSELPWSNVVVRATAAASNESAMGVLTLPVSR